jgi:membrane associated rhomboid family serine protease
MNEDRKKILHSLIYPAILVVIMWLVKIFEITFSLDLAHFGLMPLKAKGLIGILTSPLLHEDFSHLSGNSIPLFVLGAMLFYFYPELAWRVLILVWLMTGTWVWVFARGNGIHIGASGIVNGLAAFLFLSGILRRDTKLMAITLLITFLYGGLIWGIFPQFFPKMNISWESHLMGILSGIALALYYRRSGPQRARYDWEDEEEEDNETGESAPPPDDNPENQASPEIPTEVRYHYKNES